MEDFSAPSFSLGFDLDVADLTTEDEDEEEEAGHLLSRSFPDKWMDEDEGFRKPFVQELEESDVTNTLDEAEDEDAPMRVLKRLRRGLPPPPLATVATPRLPVDGVDLTNESQPLPTNFDDIEEFSSPEKEPQRCADDYPSTQSHITCNSKFSLLHRGFLKDNPDARQVITKVAPASSGSFTSARLEASSVKVPFPRLTISPIRKINLLDSDSDDSPTNKSDYRKKEDSDVSLKNGKWFHDQNSACEGQNAFSTSKCQMKSFWKDFSPKKNRKFETPALDEFCEEYFISAKNQNVNWLKGETKSSGFSSFKGLDTNDVIDGYDDLDPCKNISEKVCINLDFSSPRPPSYRYFDHADPRIRTLVRQRLPHFIPLGNKNNCENQQFGVMTLDYMNQFNPTYSSGKTHVISEKTPRSSLSKNKKKQSCNDVIETTGSWVNPRSKAAIPKDAGKRRVRADVHQSGQWFTDQDGKKVYIGKDGEQSTGRTAYMKYKKETGGFRKPKKKAVAKRSRKSKP